MYSSDKAEFQWLSLFIAPELTETVSTKVTVYYDVFANDSNIFGV